MHSAPTDVTGECTRKGTGEKLRGGKAPNTARRHLHASTRNTIDEDVLAWRANHSTTTSVATYRRIRRYVATCQAKDADETAVSRLQIDESKEKVAPKVFPKPDKLHKFLFRPAFAFRAHSNFPPDHGLVR